MLLSRLRFQDLRRLQEELNLSNTWEDFGAAVPAKLPARDALPVLNYELRYSAIRLRLLSQAANPAAKLLDDWFSQNPTLDDLIAVANAASLAALVTTGREIQDASNASSNNNTCDRGTTLPVRKERRPPRPPTVPTSISKPVPDQPPAENPAGPPVPPRPNGYQHVLLEDQERPTVEVRQIKTLEGEIDKEHSTEYFESSVYTRLEPSEFGPIPQPGARTICRTPTNTPSNSASSASLPGYNPINLSDSSRSQNNNYILSELDSFGSSSSSIGRLTLSDHQFVIQSELVSPVAIAGGPGTPESPYPEQYQYRHSQVPPSGRSDMENDNSTHFYVNSPDMKSSRGAPGPVYPSNQPTNSSASPQSPATTSPSIFEYTNAGVFPTVLDNVQPCQQGKGREPSGSGLPGTGGASTAAAAAAARASKTAVDKARKKRQTRAPLHRSPSVKFFSRLKASGKIEEIDYADVYAITGDLNMLPVSEGGHYIGAGGFGKVFLGLYHDDSTNTETEVAAKIITLESESSRRQFRTELMVLADFQHENLLPVVGYSIDGPQYCLLYKYMPNGSLDDRLACKDETAPLDWLTRLRIAKGTAEGIVYLHSHAAAPLVHRDIKSANVLLNENMVAKIGDFGLVRIGEAERKGNQYDSSNIITRTIVGTTIYMPPEAFRFDVTIKWDTYSYGVVLLEIISGMKPIEMLRKEPDIIAISEEVSDIREFIDDKATGWTESSAMELKRIADECVFPRKKGRPLMTDVLPQVSSLLSL